MTATWTPDLLPGFDQSTISLPEASDGPVDIVLIRKRASSGTSAVLFIHGFIDYFFQSHLADFYNLKGLHFYAVDCRRHGRALRGHQHGSYTADLDEYLEDVDAAVSAMKEDGVDWILLNGHSTGGLVASLYAHRGKQRADISAVFLNSPFLKLNIPAWQTVPLGLLVPVVGRLAPELPVSSLSPVYGLSLHSSKSGEWEFNLDWKPTAGFPVRAGWLRAIMNGHAEVAAGLSITQPVLVLHSSKSAWPSDWQDVAYEADVVLNVEHIKTLAPRLGGNVEIKAVENGMHDLILSKPGPREMTFAMLGEWIDRVRAGADGGASKL
jgi:alpha-beta hydrolase superfamily lysophospholipase